MMMGMKPRPKTKKYQLVVLNFGYVESGSLSKVFFYNTEGYFESKEEALRHLAHSLLSMYFGEQDYLVNGFKTECCKEAVAKDDDYDYCPKCRRQLKVKYEFEEFEEWINTFPGETADSFPNSDDYMYWWPWVTWKEIVQLSDRAVEVEDSAGSVLTAMIKIEDLDGQAAQENSPLNKLGVEAIKKAWQEWAENRDFTYLKEKIH
jgi:hypothetical protein